MPRRSRNLPANRPRPSLPPGQTQTLMLTPTHSSTKPSPVVKQPSLFNQMATTAAGVAVGSVVADSLSNSLLGRSEDGAIAAEPESSAAPRLEQQVPQGTCGLEIQNFLKCAEDQSDLSNCRKFNEAVRQCRINNNLEFQKQNLRYAEPGCNTRLENIDRNLLCLE